MKICLVTAYFFPEVSSVTHLLSDLADDLAFLGHEVTVVCNRPNRGLDDETVARYESLLDERLNSGVRVLRVGPKGRENGGLVRRGLRFIGGTIALCRAAARQNADVYLINSMPPYLGLAGAKLARRAKTCFILQDLFPDSVIAMGKLKERGPVTTLCRRMEKITLERNSHFVTISPDMKKTLLKKGVPEGKLTVIPNWADADRIRPVPRSENGLFSDFHLDPKGFYAVYAGALGILQTPGLILDAAKLTAKANPAVTYLIIGSGGLEAGLKARAKAEGIQNVRFFPAQPVPRVPEIYSLGDVSLVTLQKGVTDIAMPSKTWTAMAAGSPVLAAADENSAYERALCAAGAMTFAPGDAASLDRAAQKAYAERENLHLRGLSERRYIEEHLNRKTATAAYERALAALIND